MSRLFSTYERVVITSKVESDPSDIIIMAKFGKREARSNSVGVMQGKNCN